MISFSDRLNGYVKTTLTLSPANEDWSGVLYLLEHQSDRFWRTPGFAPIRRVTYLPQTFGLNVPLIQTLSPNHNVALAFVANDYTLPAFPGDVDLSQGGRLLLAHTTSSNSLALALSKPNDFGSTWVERMPVLRLSLSGTTEPDARAGISLLAEPGYHANPRLLAKNAGDLNNVHLSPYVDGIRNVDLLDVNDWWIIRDGICSGLVRFRCDQPDCTIDQEEILETCGAPGPYPAGFPPGLLHGGGAYDEVQRCDFSE